jgi:hypothetical protein
MRKEICNVGAPMGPSGGRSQQQTYAAELRQDT